MDSIAKWFAEITPGGVGIWTAVGLIVVALIRQKPITQKLADEREGNLLKERAADMKGMRRRITELEAEQRVDRHNIGNLEQVLDMILNMIEIDPGRAVAIAAKAREVRAAQKLELAAEKAGLHSEKIAAAVTEDTE